MQSKTTTTKIAPSEKFTIKVDSPRFLLLSRSPINWKTPIGYISLLLIQFVGVFTAALVALPNVTFLIGSTWLFNCIAKDVTNDLAGLNVNRKSISNRKVVRERFCSIVKLFSELKQLSDSMHIDRCTVSNEHG